MKEEKVKDLQWFIDNKDKLDLKIRNNDCEFCNNALVAFIYIDKKCCYECLKIQRLEEESLPTTTFTAINESYIKPHDQKYAFQLMIDYLKSLVK